MTTFDGTPAAAPSSIFDGTPATGLGSDHILTVAQAAGALRVAEDDPRLLDLLPQIDLFIQNATGRDWTQDVVKHKTAVSAATMLLVQWYEDPAMIGTDGSMNFGLSAALIMLEAEALKYRGVLFFGSSGAGAISLADARLGDVVIRLVGVYGASGDQSAGFESVVSVAGQLQQISDSDLSEKSYFVFLKSPMDDLVA